MRARYIGYSILLSIFIIVIVSFIDVAFRGKSFSREIFDYIVILIVIAPIIYLLLHRLLRLESEHKMLSDKEELIRLSTEHAILYELSDQFLKTNEGIKIMDIAVKTVGDYFNPDIVEICVPDEKEKWLILVSGVGLLPGYVGTAKIPVNEESCVGYAFLKRTSVMMPDISKDSRFKPPDILMKHEIKSGFSVPMIASGFDGEKVIGVIGVHFKKPRDIISKDIWFLTLMANETAIAIEKTRLTEELKSSKEFLASVLEGIGEGVIVLDRDFRIVSANSAYMSPGKSEARIIGEHCYKISHHSETACHELGHDCPVLRTFQTGEHASGIHTHYNSNGRAYYMEVHSYPLKDPSGNVAMVVETITDVTKRREIEKKLVESEERYRDLYDNAPDIYFSIGADETVVECNNTTAQTLGYGKEELIGKHINLFVTTFPEELDRRLTMVRTKGSLANLESRWKTKDNRLIDVILHVTAFYDKDGNYVSARVSARDITEKKAVEEELKKRVKELEDFYNMAVDRESKMIELKKEIEKLKERIPWVSKDE